MATVRMLARLELRRRWRGTVALALLVGAIGALVLASAAGARRSDTSLARFNADSRAADVEISIGFPTAAEMRAFRKTPGIKALALAHGYALMVGNDESTAVAVPADSAFGNSVDRVRIIKGRRPDPKSPSEATVGEHLAQSMHLHPGSNIDAVSYTQAQITKAFAGGDPGPPAGPKIPIHVVGIGRLPLDLSLRASAGGVVVVSPGFNAKYGKQVGLFTDSVRVETDKGASQVAQVVNAARKLWGKAQTFQVQPLGVEAEGANGAINVLTLALWIFAGVAALAGLVAIAIVLTRDIGRATIDQSTLRSLGATRAQRLVAIGARALLIAATGAVVAAIGAVILSPLFPVGIARKADPDVGFHADWLVLAAGIAALALIVVGIAFAAAWRATRTLTADRLARARRRTSPVVETAARTGLRPTVINGLRMALQSERGDGAVPVRSAYAGAVFGVAGITAVLIFAASLAHLVDTPRLAGWTFDLKTEVPDRPGSVCTDGNDYGLAHTPGVAAVAAACFRDLDVDGHPISAEAIDNYRGTIDPEVVEGRAPRGADEVALGAVTLATVHKHIGDRVTVRHLGLEPGTNRATDQIRTYTVVGRIVLPSMSTEDPQPLADGAAFTVAGMRPLIKADANQTHPLFVKLAPGANRAAVVAKLKAVPRAQGFSGPTVPVEIGRLQQIGWFPTTLALLLAVLALLAVGHTLVTSVRRRRRELALFKTIGFRRRQVRATVAWQATTIAVAGLVIGIPVGLVIGRAVWDRVAGGLGVATVVAVPTLALVAVAVAGLVLTNVIAFFPARAASRTRPAIALRSE